jgi:NAD+-dependent secondary alcohol dehydrogenase Adh1
VAVAALADAGLTAYHAVRKAVPLLYPGTTCVVIGAGGLGHIGIQCLVAMTATTVVVVDPNEKARALATELGAHRVVASADELDEGSAHVVLDFVGEQGAEKQGLALTRRAGSYFVIGYGGSIDIPTIDLISTERNIIGNLVGSYNDLAELMTLAAQGKVTLHTKTYPLAAVSEAMDDLEAGRLQGRGILVP